MLRPEVLVCDGTAVPAMLQTLEAEIWPGSTVALTRHRTVFRVRASVLPKIGGRISRFHQPTPRPSIETRAEPAPAAPRIVRLSAFAKVRKWSYDELSLRGHSSYSGAATSVPSICSVTLRSPETARPPRQ